MERKEFLKVAGLLGISLPFQPMAFSCTASEMNDLLVNSGNFNGSVLVLGAGAAGMAAGHLLAQQGIDFTILEASATYGGRMKQTTSFTNFPIPLGAEWLHSSRSDLESIVNDPSVQITTQTQGYAGSDTIGYYDGTLSMASLQQSFGSDYSDQKFINSTWFDFFETYVVPGIQNNMVFNTRVVSVDYSGDKVIVTDASMQEHTADKVIFTIPLKMLQRGEVTFTPSLPSNKLSAISKANVWGGFKAFFKFTQKFYPTFLTFPDSETNDGQRLYYDASYGQATNDNILGLFSVGLQAEQYQQLAPEAQRDYILNELDTVFKGQASANYVDHIVQNWNEEPFIGGAYLADVSAYNIAKRLGRSVEEKVFFAGEAYTQEYDWGSVHVAANAAWDAIQEILA